MGKKVYHFDDPGKKAFIKQITDLCGYKSSWSVWSDFITMAAISIANAFDQKAPLHDEREQEYLNIIKGYAPKEQKAFPELFAMVVEALEQNPEQDFLGEMFMALDLGNHWKGQFFTPYYVSQTMAAMIIDDRNEEIQKRGWAGIHDPCCGAGALLIAARNQMVKKGYGSTQALYVAQDIDRTAALMCYLQLSLLGCAGYVVVGNALTQPIVGLAGSPLLISPKDEQEVWIMPALYETAWIYRILTERVRLLTASP